ncbi:MAG: transcription-repair coupling factor [Phycisphaerales bacterium]
MDLVGFLAAEEAVGRIVERALHEGRAAARGAAGSSTHFLAGAVARRARRPVLLVVAHVDDADEALDELVSAGVDAARFPALETLPGESGVSLDLLAERLSLVRRVLSGAGAATSPGVIVAPIAALMQPVPRAESLGQWLRVVTRGEEITGGPAALVRWLDGAGYRRVDAIEEPGEYAARGGILDVFPPGDAREAASPDGLVESLGGAPVRLDFFGDTVEQVREIDIESMAADRALRSVQLVAAKPELLTGESGGGTSSVIDVLPRESIALLHELAELNEQGRGYYERCLDARGIFGPPAVFKGVRERLGAVIEVEHAPTYAGGVEGGLIELPVSGVPVLPDDAGKAVADVVEWADAGSGGPPTRVVIVCQNDGEMQRLGELLAQFAPEHDARVERFVAYVHQGFVWRGEGERPTLVLPYHELLNRFTTRRRAVRLRAGRAMDTFLELSTGDYVVHAEHGIARYLGLVLLGPMEAPKVVGLESTGFSAGRKRASATAKNSGPKRDGATGGAGAKERGADDEQAQEYLVLEFDGGTRLHVPAAKCALVTKYIGGFKGKPPLSTLGGQRWKGQKERVAASVRDLAAELMRVRAARETMPGIRFPADTPWQREFEDEFPYDETEDQLAALGEIKKDMQGPRPMDRLLCGDVGYGKTELAIRAAFKCAEYGKQAAVLVPTTVLAEQHERTFRGRFKDYPFKVASISRFKSDAEVREVLEELAKGRIDVIIGTHRLLSKDVKFADLGLVVIDEEQRFGVEHKERLLSLRLTADILTLSATPIPRTLHMAMLGIRDISSLATAPADRRAVVTEVVPRNPVRLKQVIDRELAREGQVYYVHNRVYDILSVADDVQKLAPGARVVVGHGQMPDRELEEVILKFVRREADILVSTTIIESGIDIPTANTMIIDDADRFGLADLHQLRGRVGRYKHRAYCYLLLPENRPLKETAKQRLKAVEQFSMLGAGFKIAMRDLEIRGAGNILGPEQSGHIAAVGYDMYCRLLEQSVKELKNEVVATPNETVLNIGVVGVIPKGYIPAEQRRLEAYRRVSLAATLAELRKVEEELAQAYGEPPTAARRLLDLAEIRIGARALGVRSMHIREKDLIFMSDQPQAVAERFRDAKGQVVVLAPGGAGAPKAAPAPGALWEVYWRPVSANAFEANTLIVILKKRMAAG